MDSAGDGPNDVEIVDRDGFLEAQFLGTFSIERFKRQAEAASAACRERKMEKLLVDVTRLDAHLSTFDRYELASHAVRVSWGLKVALFVTPDFLDTRKFGILVAQNRGLKVDAFTDRRKAVDWLLAPGPKAAEPGPGASAP